MPTRHFGQSLTQQRYPGPGAGAEAMTFSTGTPKQIVEVVQACLIVAVAARIGVRRRRGGR